MSRLGALVLPDRTLNVGEPCWIKNTRTETEPGKLRPMPNDSAPSALPDLARWIRNHDRSDTLSLEFEAVSAIHHELQRLRQSNDRLRRQNRKVRIKNDRLRATDPDASASVEPTDSASD